MARPLTFREVIDVLLEQGATVPCFRCGQPITTGKDAEREHYVEKALGGDDSAGNARISHKDCHAKVTRGTGATTAGSSIGRIAKTKRITRTGKMAVVKREPGQPRPQGSIRSAGFRPRQPGHTSFPPRGSRPMRRPA